ncbi:uncharacterized protein LOC122509642 [Leptopilina heterotoma]|uniref:uncharacterized protein LOC122509642 n=1 Tax=Leptopilina heterotoma TaxID=63436 RepID=UPI001CA9F440|nr:uncharacterized protein LOC122509642 [Leptopilina heterotoma]
MLILQLLSLITFFCISNTERIVNWNTEEIERTVRPIVRKFDDSWKVHTSKEAFYHHKSHFGIIIKNGTTFSLTTKELKNLSNFYFFCIAQNYKDVKKIKFEEHSKITNVLTTTSDCVPMMSVSYNIDVEVKLTTNNWIDLPVFDSRNMTYLMAENAEKEFYKKVEIYGFVENYYVQVLLSANDIRELQFKDYSLFVGLQNQVDVIKYYNYLTSASRYVNKNDSYAYALVEKHKIFSHTNEGFAGGHFDFNSIRFTSVADTFLDPTRGLQWSLLHEMAHYYDIKSNVIGIGYTFESWTNIYCAFYQHKFSSMDYWVKYEDQENNTLLSNYRNGITIENKKWDYKEKVHFYLTLFAYDGTDKSFREFNIRYFSENNTEKENVLQILSEVFFDLYDINIFPFLKKVINTKTNPFIPYILELQLLTGRAVMPAIDFGLKPTEMKLKSRERDWRPYLPLMLITKMIEKYVEVTFTIESQIDPTGACLYLNNICHKISGNRMTIKLLSDVYSTYILFEKNQKTYVSDIEYHTISKDTNFPVKVNDLQKAAASLSLIENFFIIEGLGSMRFMTISINYKDMSISIQQTNTNIHHYFPNKLYFAIGLKRNNSVVFIYKFLGSPERNEALVREHKFEINDKIYIFHAEPHRLKFNLKGYNNFKRMNTFLLTSAGLHNVADRKQKIIPLQVKKVNDFYLKYNRDLRKNAYFQAILLDYMNVLRSNGLEENIPQNWITPSGN